MLQKLHLRHSFFVSLHRVCGAICTNISMVMFGIQKLILQKSTSNDLAININITLPSPVRIRDRNI